MFKANVIILVLSILMPYCLAALYNPHPYDHDYPPHPPNYEYGYAVHDGFTGDIKEHHEERHGDHVNGRYSLLDSNGCKRVVDYHADDHNGFNAVVRCEGHPHPPLHPIPHPVPHPPPHPESHPSLHSEPHLPPHPEPHPPPHPEPHPPPHPEPHPPPHPEPHPPPHPESHPPPHPPPHPEPHPGAVEYHYHHESEHHHSPLAHSVVVKHQLFPVPVALGLHGPVFLMPHGYYH